MGSSNLCDKIARECLGIQRAWVEVAGQNRGKKFKLTDWQPLLERKKSLAPHEGQSKVIFDLYKGSADAAYQVLTRLTSYIRPEDEPWLEHYQTTAVFSILYEHDSNFKDAARRLAEAIDRSGDLIQQEVFARLYGRYGPTWIVDYVATPGSFSNLLKMILHQSDMKPEYRWAFVNAVSAARNTSYSVMLGSRFLNVLDETGDISAAMEVEKERLREMWLDPIETQIQIMEEVGHRSFDYERCLLGFRERIHDLVVDAARAGVHYANISLIPLWSAGDFHHISQTTYNLLKGDIEMAVLEAITESLEKTLERATQGGKLGDAQKIPIWEVTAAAAARIMQLDGFTSSMVRDLLMRRLQNLILEDPRILQYECMNDEFVNFLRMGEHFLAEPPLGLGGRVGGVEIDLSPIEENEVLSNPHRYSWPGCPITARFAALLKFADEPFHLMSDPLICLYSTELIALKPQEPYFPRIACKQCAIADILPNRCKHCLARNHL